MLEEIIDDVRHYKAEMAGLNFEIDQDNLDDLENDNKDDSKEQEYKPFDRALQEMTLWRILAKNTLIAFVCTFFDFFNFDIYAPLLIFYFFFITCLLCRVKIEHMIRYQYCPINFGGK